MNYIKSYKIFESNNSSIWTEIEDILSPIKDSNILTYDIGNIPYTPTPNKLSLINIQKHQYIDLEPYAVADVKDEVSHLCNRFPDIITQVSIFRSNNNAPTKYTPDEFLKESPVGNTYIVSIYLKIKAPEFPV